ncbi:MAG: hypothetical protein H6584_03745 [Flavobacteriales bacterium]|nr:hypothetical protein [Flavobacteriales bacterium]
MARIGVLLIFLISFFCDNAPSAYRFSNYYGSEADGIVRAIESEDIVRIKKELVADSSLLNFKDEKHETSLLALTIVNDKKIAFQELLRLGANPNISDGYCDTPIMSAIRHCNNCDLYYIQELLKYGAEIHPDVIKNCTHSRHEPISETILYYNNEDLISCGIKIVDLLVAKSDKNKLLHLYNNDKDYMENIVFNCLGSLKNLSMLKYLIVDLKCDLPQEIYINGTVVLGQTGYMSLLDILKHKGFVFNRTPDRLKAIQEITQYLENKER